MNVEIAFAIETKQLIVKLDVPKNTTAIKAIKLSKITSQFPEYDMENAVTGIFSQKILPNTILQEHNRVEIYRPLQVDPKKKRRVRAQAATNNAKKYKA